MLDFVTVGGGTLALIHRPRLRSLPAIKAAGATHLVTLLSRREGAGTVGSAARAVGLTWVWLAWDHGGPPRPAQAGEFAAALTHTARLLDDGAAIVIHCSAGVHRTGMFAYGLLRRTGLATEPAMSVLRLLRPATADGVGQERMDWVERLFTSLGWPSG